MKYEKEADLIGYFSFGKYTKDHYPTYNPIPHFHNSTEILIVVGGEYTAYTNGKKRVLKAGSINFVESLKPHTSGIEQLTDDLEVYVMVVSDSYLAGVREMDKRTFPEFIENKEGFEEILELVKWGFERRETMNEEMKIGFITMVMGLFKKHFPFVEKSEESGSELIVGIMKHIAGHYKEDITLESLSREMKYESTYLSRVFNRFFGMNLREYLNRYRISEFLKLREQNPEAPTYKLSCEVGFVSDNTFYRAFNKYSEELKHNF